MMKGGCLFMQDYLSSLLGITVEEFIRSRCLTDTQSNNEKLSDIKQLFVVLVNLGCDYYELISLYSDFYDSSDMVDLFIALAPIPFMQMPVSPIAIRSSIVRWTASKYHSAPISEVVEGIHNIMLGNVTTIVNYDSNRNLRNKRVVNDRYILLTNNERRLLLDINRKRTISFIREDNFDD